MLLELHIKDYALVEEAVLEFGPGLNVLTGETGTGKSIIIDAVMLLLGGRGSLDQIRTGCQESIVHGVFTVPQESPLRENLTNLGIRLSEENTMIITCSVSRTGRSRRNINGCPVTQSMLMDIGEYLVDIHGQHEHQTLLKSGKHIEYLDNFSGEDGLAVKKQVKSYFRHLTELEEALKEFHLNERERTQRLDLIKFQSQEIAAANLIPGEDTSLIKEHNIQAAADEFYGRASLGYFLIHGEDRDTPGAIDKLDAALCELEPILEIDDSLTGVKDLLLTALAACEEASREIRLYRDGIDRDPRRLAEIESRLAVIQRLKEKYGGTVDEILGYRQVIDEEIESLESSFGEATSISKQITAIRLKLGKTAEKLRNIRMKASEKLRQLITCELQELAMEESVFDVDFKEVEDPKGVPVGEKLLAIRPDGIDIVEFLLSANPGEPLKPLARIASGGEISRVMLALKSILASADEVETLIFDEIDAGIGGKTATVIGNKLATIGKMRQVICVTHLPQIACMGDTHYSIGKEIKSGRTRTFVNKLQGSERVEEIARMLGGHPGLSGTSIRHAKELLKIG